MSGRSLAYLSSIPVERVKGLSGRRGSDLRQAGIASVADLLLHVPRRYLDRSEVVPLAAVPVGHEVTVTGTVHDVDTRRPRRNLTMVEATLFDGTSYLEAVWFNQPYRARQLQPGVEVALSGKVERFRGRLQMSSPAVDVLSNGGESLVTGRVVPIHPTAGGVAPGHLRRGIHNALWRSRPIADPLPEELRGRLGLLSRDEALAAIHFPESLEDVEPARLRLVFDELFRLEVALAMRKHRQAEGAVGISHETEAGLVEAFLEALPFTLTSAQQRVLEEIQADMAAPHPMHRLLQGEVGSGKTVVALAALLTGVQGGYQGAVMAPTEVLAEQHFLNMEPLCSLVGVRLGLLTSSSGDREEVLQAVADGTCDVAVGTHALIQEGVRFARLGMAVVDEQHRFGVYQRVQLKEKGEGLNPDLLIMTATPIPRTLSMTLYGDLDVSLLGEMPPGRPQVETRALSPGELEGAYELSRAEAKAGHQTFVVCPLVEESPKVEAASATAEYERLQGIFPDLRLALLHGQMRPAEKREVMERFRDGEVDVLVSTTVIEVGIDVPNATVMVVEDAHRFGLSQLHQLRGRLWRGIGPCYCILVGEATTEEGRARLAAMVSTDDGFRLAEEDLRIRGQGTVFGARQAGLADLKMADILRDAETLVTARREAFALVAADPDLSRHRPVAEEVRALLGDEVEWLFIS
ncbi:MAG: ATP-dependent DNA helicase RecG [Actinomycetota bacterium]|nr:ATP-dependent DNA helicase RecG [Actinomycetota bacterium]